jgi:hypothetical protein
MWVEIWCGTGGIQPKDDEVQALYVFYGTENQTSENTIGEARQEAWQGWKWIKNLEYKAWNEETTSKI